MLNVCNNLQWTMLVARYSGTSLIVKILVIVSSCTRFSIGNYVTLIKNFQNKGQSTTGRLTMVSIIANSARHF